MSDAKPVPEIVKTWPPYEAFVDGLKVVYVMEPGALCS